ncbi:WAT1-related protein At4g30420 [Linum perenne]
MENYKPEIAMTSLQFSYAVISIAGRAALLEGLSPRVFVVYRQAIAAITISPIAYFSRYLTFEGKQGGPSIGIRSFALIFLAALIGVTINQNLYFQGIYMASSSMGSATGNLVPGITFVMAVIFGLEKVNLRSVRSMAKIVGTILCVTGALTMALIKGPQLFLNNGLGGNEEDWLLGCCFLFASACCWSIWLILQVPVTTTYPDPLSVSAWMCFLGALQSGIVTFFMEPDLNAWKLTSNLQLASCLFTGVVGSGIAFFVQAWCISQRGPLFSALFNPLCTVIVTVLASFLLDEKIYVGSLIGAIGVVVGLYAVLWGKSKDYAKKVEGEIDPKPTKDETQVRTMLIDEECLDETKSKICDIEEPLLCNKI